MLKEHRQEIILKLLEQQGEVSVTQLCSQFNVTDMTIRRDLNDMEAAGKITRTHGGAVLNNSDLLLEKPFSVRLNKNVKKKEAIAAASLGLISDGQKIFISSGSTLYNLAKMIDSSLRLCVVTDGLNTALELSSRTNISIIVIGGELRKNTLSTTGTFAENMIRQFSFETAIIGVTGIGADGKLFHSSLVEKGLYETIASVSKKVIVLADSDKIGKNDFVCVGSLMKGYTLITNEDAPEVILKNYSDMGIDILLV